MQRKGKEKVDPEQGPSSPPDTSPPKDKSLPKAKSSAKEIEKEKMAPSPSRLLEEIIQRDEWLRCTFELKSMAEQRRGADAALKEDRKEFYVIREQLEWILERMEQLLVDSEAK